MHIRKKSFGLAANAALLRAAVETGITHRKAEEYARLIFNIFKLNGKNSYEELLEILKEEDNIQRLAESIESRGDFEGMFEFAKAFLEIKTYKRNTEKIQKVFTGLAGETLYNRFNIFPDACSFGKEGGGTINEAKDNSTLHILDCEIKTQVLTDMQHFQYIEVPEEYFKELEKDFNIAEHLKVLSEIHDSNEADGRLMLVSESMGTGLVAMKYLSSLASQLVDSEEDEEGEISFLNKLPVVNASQIDSCMQQGISNSTLFSGSFGFQTVQNMNAPEPWWTRHEEIPLIVLVQKGSFLSEEFPEKLKTFRQIYPDIFIVFEKEKVNDVQDTNNSGTNLFNTDLNAIAEDISFKLAYNTYEIKDPEITSEYMKRVFIDAAFSYGYKIGASVNIEEVLKQLKKARGKGWEGNSSVVQLIRKAISMKKRNLGVLNNEDFDFLGRSLIAVKNKEVQKKQEEKQESALEFMNRCIFGLDHVKQDMLNAVNMLKLNKEREKAGLKPGKINNVFAFYGPPGVGKTAMAEHFSEIMFENNLLPGRRFININGAQLKGAYVGHTAPKVQAIFNNNDIIFIDECYSLTASDFSMDTFSQEALAELCIQLEKWGHQKLIVFAGYGGDVDEKDNMMKKFLEANPGLASRVGFHVNFPKYSADYEMPHIFNKIANNSDYILEEGWKDIVINFFREREKSESYGNGREARKLFQNTIIAQSARLSGKSHDAEALKHITLEDINSAAAKILGSESRLNCKEKISIGF